MPTCLWCCATECDPSDAFHELLSSHGLHVSCWSCVGEGWIPLLDRLCADLRELGWPGSVAQIKEKMGALRFYADGLDDAMQRRIQAAAAESARTCETCGVPAQTGLVPGTGTYATLCFRHLGVAAEPTGG